MCKCKVTEGGGSILPTETGHINKQRPKEGQRLACQVKVKNDLKIHVPDEVLEIKKFEGTVRSNRNVATFIKEFIVDLPKGVDLNFKAGGYIQIDIPKYELSFKDFDIDPKFRDAWDRFKLWDLKARTPSPASAPTRWPTTRPRATCVMLNVRIATPPPNMPAAKPGIASSFISTQARRQGLDQRPRSANSSPRTPQREMMYIGGGAGMAPCAATSSTSCRHQEDRPQGHLLVRRPLLREMFYAEDFRHRKGFPQLHLQRRPQRAPARGQLEGHDRASSTRPCWSTTSRTTPTRRRSSTTSAARRR
jgi:Na+-transporting NADH:ubiquinone oxidoreductase subunit F